MSTIDTEHKDVVTEASAPSAIVHDLRFAPRNPWGISQPTEHTHGTPGHPGAGARRAIHRFANTLRALKDH
jgi:hypothetical protein